VWTIDQNKFCLLCGNRKTQTPKARLKKVISATSTPDVLPIDFFLTVARRSCLRIQFLLRQYLMASSLRVCRWRMYSFQRTFCEGVLRSGFWYCLLQCVQRYLWRPLRIPFLITAKDWQKEHFFSHFLGLFIKNYI
jgi:hypothetical protein